jgi:hypothetical protein
MGLVSEVVVESSANPGVAPSGVYGGVLNKRGRTIDPSGIMGVMNNPEGESHPVGAAVWGLLRGGSCNSVFVSPADNTGVDALRASSEVNDTVGGGEHARAGLTVTNSLATNTFEHGVFITGALNYGVRVGSGWGLPSHTVPTWPFAFLKATGVMGFSVDGTGATTINANAATLPAVGGLGSGILHVGDADSANTRVLVDAFQGIPGITGRRANGTNALKSALNNGEVVLSISALGYGTTYGPPTIAINFVTSGSWSDASQPSAIEFYATPSGSTSIAKVAAFDKPSASRTTGFMLWDVDNNTLERVTVGDPDSGGSGYKVLRIPN